MKLTALVIIGLLLAIGVAAFAADFPVTVSAIAVEGNDKISTHDILAVVKFHPGDEITAADLKKASQAIYDLGWFSEVVPSVEDGGKVIFRVKENPVVKKIEISGNDYRESYGLFGVTLFRYPIVSKDKIRSILRDNGVKIGKILNNNSLNDALQAILDAYDKKGYTLIGIGKVIPGETLKIEIVEGKVEENVITGLTDVPVEVAQKMIDIPLHQPVKKSQIQAVVSRLRSSIYFSDVDVTTQPGSSPDSVKLVWKITARKLIDSPVKISGIDLTGVTLFPEGLVESTLGDIPTEPVDNYHLLTILKGLYDLYYRNGYIMVRFKVGGVKDGRLQLTVEEGRIGEIAFSGNERTKEYVLAKSLGIKVGEILNRSRLAVSYQRMMSSGYFKSVNIVPEWADDHVKLSVTVAEATKLGGINGSLAYSPESGGLVGKIDYHQKNLFGTGQDLTLSYSRGLVNDQSATWDLGYSTIAFFREFNRVGVDLYRKSNEKTVDGEKATYLTRGGKASVSYPWADYTDLNLSYKHEEVREETSLDWTPIDSVTIGFSYDDVDNPRFPISGARRSVSLEKAGGFAPGEEFDKLDLSWSTFTTVHLAIPWIEDLDQVFAERIVLGWGLNIPASQAYTLGGSTTIRGVEGTAVDRLAYANFEYRVRLVEGLTTTLFFDGGIDLGRMTMTGMKGSVGIEFGIEAAGMYVRLDVAWPLGSGMSLVPHFDFGFSPMF